MWRRTRVAGDQRAVSDPHLPEAFGRAFLARQRDLGWGRDAHAHNRAVHVTADGHWGPAERIGCAFLRESSG